MKNILGAELLKLKNSKILYLTMFLPIFFVILGYSNFIRYKELFTSKGQNVWQQLYTQSALFYGMFLLSLFVTIVMALLVWIENSEDNFKRILSLPINRKKIYLAKLIIGCAIVLLNILIFIAVTIIAGIILTHNLDMPSNIIISPLLSFIALLPVISIQYYLSMKFSNIGAALGIGAIFSIPSLLISNTRFWILFPWTYPGRALLTGANISDTFHADFYMYALGVIISIIFILIGMEEFDKKDIT